MSFKKNKLITFLIFSTLPLFSADKPIDEFLYQGLTKNTSEVCRKVFAIGAIQKEIGSYLDSQEIKNKFKAVLGSDNFVPLYDYAKMKEAVALAILYKKIDRSKDSLMIELSRVSTFRTTWFTAAVQEKDLQMTTLFLEHGFDMNVCDRARGRTAFMTACADGAEDIALAFIKHGVDVNSRYNFLNNGNIPYVDQDQTTPLFLTATGSGVSYTISKALIDHGADMYARVSGQTVLHLLASRSLDDSGMEVLQFLLDRNFDLTLQDRKGNTVVHKAVAHEGSPLKELLKQIAATSLACLGMINNDGETPLHVAAYRFQCEHVKLLIEHGVDDSVKDCFGNTPLQAARKISVGKSYHTKNDRENKKAVIKLLTEYQAKKDKIYKK